MKVVNEKRNITLYRWAHPNLISSGKQRTLYEFGIFVLLWFLHPLQQKRTKIKKKKKKEAKVRKIWQFEMLFLPFSLFFISPQRIRYRMRSKKEGEKILNRHCRGRLVYSCYYYTQCEINSCVNPSKSIFKQTDNDQVKQTVIGNISWGGSTTKFVSKLRSWVNKIPHSATKIMIFKSVFFLVHTSLPLCLRFRIPIDAICWHFIKTLKIELTHCRFVRNADDEFLALKCRSLVISKLKKKRRRRK